MEKSIQNLPPNDGYNVETFRKNWGTYFSKTFSVDSKCSSTPTTLYQVSTLLLALFKAHSDPTSKHSSSWPQK